MKKIKPIILYIFISIFMISCDSFNTKKPENLSKDDFTLIKINNEYILKVPKYMSKADLNDEASLQYQNILKETYSLIIDESKDEFVSTFKEIDNYNDAISVAENYRNVHVEYLEESVVINRKSNSKSLKINNLNAVQLEIDATFDGIDITYFLTFITGSEKVYMIMNWTLENRKDKYRNTFDKMANSFKTIRKKFGKREKFKN